MVLLSVFLAFELVLLLGTAMFLDGRRPRPSVWIRSDILLAIVANVAVALLLFAFSALVATLLRWSEHGLQVSYPWAIPISVVVTWGLLYAMHPARRLAGYRSSATPPGTGFAAPAV